MRPALNAAPLTPLPRSWPRALPTSSTARGQRARSGPTAPLPSVLPMAARVPCDPPAPSTDRPRSPSQTSSGPLPQAPRELRVVPQARGLPSLCRPQVVQDDASLFLRFAREDGDAKPFIRWQFDIKSAALDGAGPRQEALRDLHLQTARQALEAWLARADAATLRVDLAPSEDGVMLTLEGNSAHARQALDEALRLLTRSTPSYEAFCDSRDRVRRAYDVAPSASASLRQRHTPAQRLSALASLRVFDLLAFSRQLGDCAYVIGFVYGNMAPADVEGVRANLARHLGSTPYETGHLRHRQFTL